MTEHELPLVATISYTGQTDADCVFFVEYFERRHSACQPKQNASFMMHKNQIMSFPATCFLSLESSL